MSIAAFAYRWRREISAGVLSGVLLAVSFPPYPLRFFSLFALVPLIWFFIRSEKSPGRYGNYLKRGFVLGFVSGLVFFGILLYWVANVIPASSVTNRWVLAPGVLLLVIYLSCFTGLFGMFTAFLVRRYRLRALIAVPALWSIMEVARSNGELAFSWGLLANSLAEYPAAIQALSIYGPYGFSFLIITVNLLTALVLFIRPIGKKAVMFVLLAVIISVHTGYGMHRIERFDKKRKELPEKNDIAVIQPNVSLDIKWKPEYKDSIFSQIETLVRKASEDGADLVIFPETSAPVALSRSRKYRDWLERIARDSEVELLIGYIDHSFKNGRWVSYNTAGLFDAEDGLVEEYHKVNLLPFGEKIPFSQYFASLEEIDFGQANFKRGREKTLFDSGKGKFGVLICFESTFPGYVRDYVRGGAEFLVNITNDGWFGSSRGPLQHSETAILRAVENGVSVLRAANTGVSMYIDPTGRVRKRLDLNVGGKIECSARSFASPTIYVRYGNTIFLVLVILSFAAVVISDPAGLIKKSKSK
ncbi:MAG: apolipoprotein N-acyltransferase [Candidatus Krumholzibacteriota bacterium]|nr:apolipoprotein N-acyltransferase [Candidatus Krumholzibacteriota bacterium]